MPPLRSIRQRAVTNENDENGGSTRLTRAKAAALTVPEDGAAIVKKALSTKRSTTNISNASSTPGQRKRAALEDVSNVTKNEVVKSKEEKKILSEKVELISKTTSSANIQKVSRTNSNRSILRVKDNNKRAASTKLKRPTSESDVLGAATKKRHTGLINSHQSIKEENADSKNKPPKKTTIIAEVEQIVETKKKIFKDKPK